MISFQEAYKKVLENSLVFETEKVPLLQSTGRILAEAIFADRDFPPFDRSTKDGIAVSFEALSKGKTRFKIEGVASAGMPQQHLNSIENCIETMTGAVVPENCDTVIMYEHCIIKDGWAEVQKTPKQQQNIHYKGSDKAQGTILLQKGVRITAGVIGAMAAVGQSEVLVKKLPNICAISTGNELVEVDEVPLPHQIRKSNTLSLAAALEKERINCSLLHLDDNLVLIEKELSTALQHYDVLLLSGGVSKGKFDFIPEVFEKLGVEKVFHRVAQRPGKPFWFGVHEKSKTVIFSFPGNPVSTFANYYIYFLPWLYKSLGIEYPKQKVILSEVLENTSDLTRFIQVKTIQKDGSRYASPIVENGSGDLTSLAHSDGFICLEPRNEIYKVGEVVTFIETSRG